MLFICGNNTDLESDTTLKKIAQNKGISIISEQLLDVNNNLLTNSLFNTTFSSLLKSDLCLTFGTNIRFEAALLNVRLKKRIIVGNFIKASLGLNDNYTHLNVSIGNSIKTLIQVAEGRHPFCKNLLKAKKPFFILGTGVMHRLDSRSTTHLITHLTRYTQVVNDPS